MCASVIKSESYYFNYSIPSYELNIKFNDSKHVVQSSLLNISYEINVHDTCGNKYSKTIKLNEIFRKTGIPSGNYFIEVIPRIETTYCKHKCLVFDHQENKVLCEDCKKTVKFVEIKNLNNKNFRCYKEIDKSFEIYADETFFMKLLIEHEESSLIAKQNQSIVVPVLLDTNQLCNKKLVVVYQEEKLSFFIVFFTTMLISLVLFSAILSIVLLFGYSKNFFLIF